MFFSSKLTVHCCCSLTCSLLGGFFVAASPLEENATSKETGLRTPSSLVDPSTKGEFTPRALELSPSEAPLGIGPNTGFELNPDCFLASSALLHLSSSVLSSALSVRWDCGDVGGDCAFTEELPASLSLIVTAFLGTTTAFEEPQPISFHVTLHLNGKYHAFLLKYLCVCVDMATTVKIQNHNHRS